MCIHINIRRGGMLTLDVARKWGTRNGEPDPGLGCRVQAMQCAEAVGEERTCLAHSQFRVAADMRFHGCLTHLFVPMHMAPLAAHWLCRGKPCSGLRRFFGHDTAASSSQRAVCNLSILDLKRPIDWVSIRLWPAFGPGWRVPHGC